LLFDGLLGGAAAPAIASNKSARLTKNPHVSVLNNGQNLIGTGDTELAVADRQKQSIVREIELRKAAVSVFLAIDSWQTRIAKFSDGWIPVTRGILEHHTNLSGGLEETSYSPRS